MVFFSMVKFIYQVEQEGTDYKPVLKRSDQPKSEEMKFQPSKHINQAQYKDTSVMFQPNVQPIPTQTETTHDRIFSIFPN